jgi:outer membrane protein OmpA-like peptidoglycan-associated protein
MLKKNTISLFVLFLFFTTSCSTPFVNPPHPNVFQTQPKSSYATMAPAAKRSASNWLTSGYLRSTYHELEKLKREGVQVVQVGQNLRVIIPVDRIFEFNSAEIRPSAIPVLNRVVTFIQRYGSVPIIINAYSDNVLATKQSLLLSQQQAKTIAGYLWSHGVVFDKVNPAGLGKINTIASNNTPTGSAFNRRVELLMPVADVIVH